MEPRQQLCGKDIAPEKQRKTFDVRLHLDQVPTGKTANLNWCAHTEVDNNYYSLFDSTQQPWKYTTLHFGGEQDSNMERKGWAEMRE